MRSSTFLHTMLDIMSYRFPRADRRIDNPYLGELRVLVERLKKSGGDARDLLNHRTELTARYAFSVPTIGILEMIAFHSPLVEIGAGNGYWARCLAQLGADVVAYDRLPPDDELPWPHGGWEQMNHWFDSEWYPVQNGDDRCAAMHPGRTLLLCWPLLDDPMASSALRHHHAAGGARFIYIGDAASSGDPAFHEMKKSYTLLARHKLWSWPGIDDYVEIYAINPRTLHAPTDHARSS
ncbi:MAG: hypothetical protein MUC76_09715 [Spirochaetes bacterium]|nr:hypothetical protein [Spirochaetota bacterium]